MKYLKTYESFNDDDNFKNWFGDSKVVDKKGQPLVVYHGSPDLRGIKDSGIFTTSFQRYKGTVANDEGVFFFSSDYSCARSYSDPKRAFDYQGCEEGVISVYLKIENPYIYDNNNQPWNKTRKVVDNVKRYGKYDGIIIKNTRDNYNNTKSTKPTTVYVVFYPNQIKSSKSNVGNYNQHSNSIYENKSDEFYTMYTGVSMEAYNNIWKNKNIIDKLTNVTSDFDFALDYSYDFKTGVYDDIVVEISNIPIDSFISYRNEDYEDDDDFIDMSEFNIDGKKQIIHNELYFLLDLYKYKDLITIKLIDDTKLDTITEKYDLGEIKSPREILDYINELHVLGYDKKEYEDAEWINKYDKYILENVKLSKLKISALHAPLVKEYSKLKTEMPPIVLDIETLYIIDGNHRAMSMKNNGEEFIKAYVGYKNINETEKL